jgi:hypothetical protein
MRRARAVPRGRRLDRRHIDVDPRPEIDAGVALQGDQSVEPIPGIGLTVDRDITDFAVRSVGKGGPILIFGVAPKVSSKMLPDFAPTNETLERVVVSRGQQLAFPLHAWAMEEFFVRRG